MKNIMKKGLMALTASLLLISASGTAQAVVTAGGSTIHNAATLTFAGGSATASVNVAVKTIAAAPTISVDSVAKTVSAGQTATYTYTITNNANGADVIGLAANVANANAGSAGLNVNGTNGTTSSVTLGGSITSQTNTVANTIVIPAGSETNLAVNDKIKIAGNVYTVSSISAGTVASTTGNTTTAETPTTITVTPFGGSPTIAVGGAPAGTQVGEQQTFTIVVTAATPSTPGTDGTHTVNVTATTTAKTQGVGSAVVTSTTSAGTSNQTITTVSSPNVTLVKKVRNVTQGVATFGTSANAQSGDTLEYELTATEATGASAATGCVIKDEVPAFTSYVVGSTKLNGTAVGDGTANTLPTTNANSGLQVNDSTNAANSGIIAAGASATVIFRVTVD